MRFGLSLAASLVIAFLAVPAMALGPCLDAGCIPAGPGCILYSCQCTESGGCLCTYYCDSNSDNQYDQKCDFFGNDLDCEEYNPQDPKRPAIIV